MLQSLQKLLREGTPLNIKSVPSEVVEDDENPLTRKKLCNKL